jgi:hypothetical protein
LKYNDRVYIQDKDKCQILKNQFSSVFTKDDGNLITFSCEPSIVKISDNFIFTRTQISKRIIALKDSFSCGPDKIDSKFLKMFPDEVSVPLEIIFNKIYESGNMPLIWKHADVVPIYKGKGGASDAFNYRPISLTCLPCKISESIIKNYFVDFLVLNNKISKFQHGFLAGRSTQTQLLVSCLEWNAALDSGMFVDVVYLDISKAFDTVSHPKLISKLSHMGIDGRMLNFIKAFLFSRSQCVKVGECVSDKVDISSGVPQGSVLGPILFLCYINDIVDVLNNACIQIFADDSKVYLGSKNVGEHVALCNDIKKNFEWASANQLKMSLEKCSILHLGNNNPKMAVSIDGFNLPTVEIVKDLGVFMSNDMKFSHHVHIIYCKAVQKSNLIYKSFISREIKFLVSMFKTYVRCIVENNTSVWSPYLLSDINKIERVQRKFTKRIPGFSNICYEERLNILCLTTLELRRLHFDLILVYKIINKLVDIDFDTFFQFSNSNTRGNSLKLFLPRTNKTFVQKAFSSRVIEPWNSLPDSLVLSPLFSFKNGLKRINLNRFLKYKF